MFSNEFYLRFKYHSEFVGYDLSYSLYQSKNIFRRRIPHIYYEARMLVGNHSISMPKPFQSRILYKLACVIAFRPPECASRARYGKRLLVAPSLVETVHFFHYFSLPPLLEKHFSFKHYKIPALNYAMPVSKFH